MRILLWLTGTFFSMLLMFIYVKFTLPFFSFLNSIDKWFMEVLNFDGGFVLDNFFYIISSKKVWIPIGIVFIISLIRNKKLRGETFFIIIAIALTVTISDQVSSSLIKPAVERLRPSHCADIMDKLHFVNNYRSGRFGFCSSHAANATGVFVFVSLLLRRKWVTRILLLWTVLVCYSRIYLGVHYPGDVICGCLVGATAGRGIYTCYIYTCKMRRHYSLKQYSLKQSAIPEKSVNAAESRQET